ncbi:uncharacterized protein N7482_008074 [Penicillium canariense]|uniref:Uncharacterized protein n=1 Tax=Penicillium canariense TaxID=189055 RepID=A0A9W9LI10_9EURO|nr:uncharacterized protein N7482_008074 [Penicillium canariense]KAJ5156974.1 hypothetical protein N7482_008074 [Penicillium canariense]
MEAVGGLSPNARSGVDQFNDDMQSRAADVAPLRIDQSERPQNAAPAPTGLGIVAAEKEVQKEVQKDV